VNGFLTAYLSAVALVLLVAFVEQALFPRFTAGQTAWGAAPGWQREVGFWNVGMLAVVAGMLWTGDTTGARVVTVALVILTVLLGTNHLLALVAGPRRRGQVVAAAANYLGAATGVLAISVSVR
jgi:hypothetical protein